MTIKLIIADDHPIFRSGLTALMSTRPDLDVVAEAENGEQVVKLSATHSPDVILMDLQMPVLDGVGAIKQILATQPNVKIIVLTTYDSDADIVPAFQAGASGYLLKDTPPQALFRAIYAANEGETTLSNHAADTIARRLAGTNKHTLSKREIEVLQLVAQGQSNKDIADTLNITEATVKSHFVHIFNKLDVTDRTAAVTVALKQKIIRLE